MRVKNLEILQSIIYNVEQHPKDIVAFVAEKFSLSKPAVLHYVKELLKEGILIAEGKTKGRRYGLAVLAEFSETLPLEPNLQEDIVWSKKIKPYLKDIKSNVVETCGYGFTEILNNAIDHSRGSMVSLSLKLTAAKITMVLHDNGIGIFKKIKESLGLEDERHAILELSKGKLTTDPEKHSGEGIFFTSRMFDIFNIWSGELFFAHLRSGNDWLTEARRPIEGTFVNLEISTNSDREPSKVFELFTSSDGDYGFTKTRVAVDLARHGDENLVSRSQAKRLLARLERFREVVLDFSDVQSIGQAFADEIFRVFRKGHPGIKLVYINALPEVERTISWVDTIPQDDLFGNVI